MKAIFEVKTILADWAPPFKKDITTEEYTASENEGFDRIQGNGNDETVFKVIQVQGDRVKVQYSNLFTPKTSGEHHGNNKTIWVSKGNEEVLSYLWGEKGMTKKIVYKGIAPTEMSNRFTQTDSNEAEESEENESTEEITDETKEPKNETPMTNLFDQA
ncbi:MAG: hypothetical protein NUV57_05470 [archaeon]|nr:hypothetical protein [archaeon]